MNACLVAHVLLAWLLFEQPRTWQGVVMVATVVYMLETGEVFSLLIAVFALAYFCIEYPRPHTNMWKILIAYLPIVSRRDAGFGRSGSRVCRETRSRVSPLGIRSRDSGRASSAQRFSNAISRWLVAALLSYSSHIIAVLVVVMGP